MHVPDNTVKKITIKNWLANIREKTLPHLVFPLKNPILNVEGDNSIFLQILG